MAVSPNGKAIALVDHDGYLWGGSSDFKVRPNKMVYIKMSCVFNVHDYRCVRQNLIFNQSLKFFNYSGMYYYHFRNKSGERPYYSAIRVMSLINKSQQEGSIHELISETWTHKGRMNV